MQKRLSKTIKIHNKTIGYKHPVFIIAEAGVNHNGRLDLALNLVDAVSESGADAIKFQTWKAEQLTTKSAKMAAYQKKNMGVEKSQFDMLKGLELREDFFEPIMKRCREKNLIFLSTPHGGFEAVDFLEKLDIPAYKFGSGDLTNIPVLEHAARYQRPMIIGTGMANMDEVKNAIDCIKNQGNNDIIALHCTTNYPCPPNEINLMALITMKKKLDVLVGYSDHTLGIQTPIMSATLGACVIEKHITLDRDMPGPDHLASTEPDEFKKMVDALRLVKTILGSNQKKPNQSEIAIMEIAKKSIVSTKNIKKGEVFTKNNIGIKRPGNGIEPRFYFDILGKISKTDVAEDSLIQKEHYE
ncbi:MAG: N-acetylneuraminate synthase [Parcubacteria group bacterium GW2011_GWA2_38_13]|nr:MAG: N-acetylneuraminate synthase [Parcubacteria group bacterium GW2011_GWA2_38_13]